VPIYSGKELLADWEGSSMRLAGAIRTFKKSKDLELTTQENKCCGQAQKADGYVDNSTLRSELTTYPQPLLSGPRKEERIAQTVKAMSPWVTHKQSPVDIYYPNPPGNCVWITHRRGET